MSKRVIEVFKLGVSRLYVRPGDADPASMPWGSSEVVRLSDLLEKHADLVEQAKLAVEARHVQKIGGEATAGQVKSNQVAPWTTCGIVLEKSPVKTNSSEGGTYVTLVLTDLRNARVHAVLFERAKGRSIRSNIQEGSVVILNSPKITAKSGRILYLSVSRAEQVAHYN